MEIREKLIVEKRDLDIRIEKLRDFIFCADTRFTALSDEHKKSLIGQERAMHDYSKILDWRISDLDKRARA